MKIETGDKVRLKSRDHFGVRGIVEEVQDGQFLIRLVDSDKKVQVAREEVTNLSLAARKAWKSMPTRSVGRPKGMRFSDRVSVTLRIDRDLWKQFRVKEADGLIDDRTATINSWLREKLAELEQVER